MKKTEALNKVVDQLRVAQASGLILSFGVSFQNEESVRYASSTTESPMTLDFAFSQDAVLHNLYIEFRRPPHPDKMKELCEHFTSRYGWQAQKVSLTLMKIEFPQ